MKGNALTAAAAISLAIFVALPVFCGEIAPKYAAYLETLGENDYASAIVYLRDRLDTRALDAALRAERAPMSVRHERVITALQGVAERTQPALLQYLDTRVEAGTVKGYTPYWLTNMVIVSATRGELEAIAQRGDVEAIEPNFRATLIEVVGRPYMGTGTAGIGVTKSLKAIYADRVWKELGITGGGTLIANLDTGVDGNHPALTDRWRGNWHPWWECWRDALGYGTEFPTDYSGHGTHTMGTMCGADHATGDTVGVAFDALWIADNSIGQGVGEEFDNDVLGAYQWFADPDGDPGTTDDVPDVLQNSWGIDSRFGYDYEDCDYRWQEVIENCEAAGVVVTYSAGNEGPGSQTHRSPANICNTPTVNFSVGAVDAEKYGWPYPIADWSSRGPSDCDGTTIKPEVCAPGVDVYSSIPGSGYGTKSGTSMAGPHVAGVVALMRQADPDVDVRTIKQVLMGTSRDLGDTGEDNTYGWGFIDAYEAVLAVLDRPYDVGVASIDAPPDVVVPLQQYPVQATVTNFGENEATFDVTCTIDGYIDTETVTLAAGSSVQVDFDTWTAEGDCGTFLTQTVYTYLGEDPNPYNDTLHTEVLLEGTHDVGVFSIDAPPDTVEPHTTYFPQATVENFGDCAETFEVYCIIGSYINLRTAVLSAGEYQQITFAPWTSGNLGRTYTQKVTTYLDGDEDPGNDSKSKTIVVGVPAVSVTLTPDATMVERGGTLGYTVEATNTSEIDWTFQYWSDVYLWTGEPYAKNPVFGPQTVTLKAGKTGSGHISHSVPYKAPLKTYSLCGRIGFHPDEIWDEDCFDFTVVEGVGYGLEGTDWEVIEADF
jgi:subtilisin family serine protease